MSVVEIYGGRVDRRYLMKKSKDELATMYLHALDLLERRTEPEATKPAQDLSAAILALPLPKPFDSGDGNHEDKFTESQFREFRAAAAALASPADALVAGDRVDAERWRFRQKFLMDGGAVLWSQRGCQYRNAQGAIICQGGTEEEAIDAAIQAQKDGHG